jgi:hypothetical protein
MVVSIGRIVLIAFCLCGAGAAASGTFDAKVLPVLRANCLPCHSPEQHTSGFSVSDLRSVIAGGARHGIAVKPGDPDKSPLVQMLRGTAKPQMPLGKTLAPADLAIIETWIRDFGAEITAALPEQSRWWAFVKPVSSPPPAVRSSDWARNDIDAFVLAKLEAKGLKPAPEASRRVLIRRLYFDLLGLPPTPEEVKAFVEDSSPQAYEALVDRLLADHRYGGRWARHWLDLARYADTNGYEGDPEWPHAWRYRDYVIDAFNHDKPYNEFIKEQIAGDEFFQVTSAVPAPPPEPEKEVALSFLRLAPFNRTPVSDENRDSLLSEITSTVGSVFLGLTVGCAKCHDHKYDSIPTRDFYRMKAFFATVQITNTGRAGGYEPADFYRPGEKKWADESRQKLKEELESAEKEFAAFQKPLIAKAAEAIKRTDPQHDKEVTEKDVERLINVESNNAASLDKTSDVFTANEKQSYGRFSERIARIKKQIERLEPMAMGLRNADGPPMGPSVPATYIQIRGNYDALGDPVEPGFLTGITGNSDPAELEIDRYKMFPTRGRRMTLAKWIANPENPLTARVMVNRIWQHHFGRGIVETPSDFGRNGSAPTHPELLDWLALRFIREKWSIKAMHRLMLTSSTYRQASKAGDPGANQIDPENLLLSHFNRQRLDGEPIRDSVLAVSGRLDLREGGPPAYPPMPRGVQEVRVQGVDTWETSPEPERLRRAVYIFQRRAQYLPMLETFDAPVLNAPCERRRPSVTSLQALAMYGGDFTNEEAGWFAKRLRREVGSDPNEQVVRAFLVAFSRPPSATEVKEAREFLSATPAPLDGLTALCRVLLNTNEFIYVD